MSDYMFMLESHLTGEQFRLVGQMQAAAAATGLSLYLTGGAMRDVLGGFPVRDLDFTVEGNPAKLVKLMTHQARRRRGFDRRTQEVHAAAIRGRSDGGNRHGALGAIREVRREADDRTCDHPRGSALPGFHRERGGAVAQQGVAGSAGRSHQRRGRHRAERAARGSQLFLLRRSVAHAAADPLQGAAGVRDRRAHAAAVRECPRGGNAHAHFPGSAGPRTA